MGSGVCGKSVHTVYSIERNKNVVPVILRKQVLVRETREMRLIFTADKVG